MSITPTSILPTSLNVIILFLMVLVEGRRGGGEDSGLLKNKTPSAITHKKL